MPGSRRDGGEPTGHAAGEDSGLINLDRLLRQMKEALPTDDVRTSDEADTSSSHVCVRDSAPPEGIARAEEVAEEVTLAEVTLVEPRRGSAPRWRWLVPSVAAALGAFALVMAVGPSAPRPSKETSTVISRAAASNATAHVEPPPVANHPPPVAVVPASLEAHAPDELPAAVAARQGAPRALASTTASARPPSVTFVDLPSSNAGVTDLGAAMRDATGAHESAAAPPSAPQQAGRPTLRPAAGALNAAIAAASREARACLAADDPPVRGTLTFDADGTATPHVPAVSSSIPGAHACVARALSQARVPPFVEGPVAVPVIVRP